MTVRYMGRHLESEGERRRFGAVSMSVPLGSGGAHGRLAGRRQAFGPGAQDHRHGLTLPNSDAVA